MSEPNNRSVHERLKRQAELLENLALESETRSSFSLNNAEEQELRELVQFLRSNLDDLRLANVQARLRDVEQVLRELKTDLGVRRDAGRPTRVIEAMVWEAENERSRVLASLSHVAQTPTRYLAFHHSGELPPPPAIPDFGHFFQNLDTGYSRKANQALRQGFQWEVGAGGGFADPDVFTARRSSHRRPEKTAWNLPSMSQVNEYDDYGEPDHLAIQRSVMDGVRHRLSSGSRQLGIPHINDYDEDYSDLYDDDYESIEESISQQFESLNRGQVLEDRWVEESEELESQYESLEPDGSSYEDDEEVLLDPELEGLDLESYEDFDSEDDLDFEEEPYPDDDSEELAEVDEDELDGLELDQESDELEIDLDLEDEESLDESEHSELDLDIDVDLDLDEELADLEDTDDELEDLDAELDDEDDLEDFDEEELEGLEPDEALEEDELDPEDEESLDESELAELDLDTDEDVEIDDLDSDLEDEDLEDLEDLDEEELEGLELDEAVDEDEIDLEDEESLDEGELDEELAALEETDDDLDELDSELAEDDLEELDEEELDEEELESLELEDDDLDLEDEESLDEGELAALDAEIDDDVELGKELAELEETDDDLDELDSELAEDDLEDLDEEELESLELEDDDLELEDEDEESLDEGELAALEAEIDDDVELGKELAELEADDDVEDLDAALDLDDLEGLDAELENDDLNNLEDLDAELAKLDDAFDEDEIDLEDEESLDEGELTELDLDADEDADLDKELAELEEADDELDDDLEGLDADLDDEDDFEDLDEEELESLELDEDEIDLDEEKGLDEGELAALDLEVVGDVKLDEELAELEEADDELEDLDGALEEAEDDLDADLEDDEDLDDLAELDDEDLELDDELDDFDEEDAEDEFDDADFAELEQDLEDLEADLSTEGPILEGAASESSDLIDELMGPANAGMEVSLGPEVLGPPDLAPTDDALFAGPAVTDTLDDDFFSGPAVPTKAPEADASQETTANEYGGEGEEDDDEDGLLDDLVLDDVDEEERLEPPTKEYRSSILEALRQVQKSDSVTSRAEVLSVLESAVPKEYRAAVSERRRLVRLSCQYEVNCYQGNQIFHATINDISLGGMKIEVTRQLETGSELHVSNPNRTEGEPDERITAQVRWFRVKDDGLAEVGLQFVDPPEVLGRSWVVSLLNKVGMQSQVFNQRKYTRATADFDIDIIDETGDVYPGRCVDLGLGGALIDTHPIFAENDIVTFRCRSFGVHGLLEAESRLVKVKHLDDEYGRYALEFENLDAATTKLLGRYVVDLLKLGRGSRSS